MKVFVCDDDQDILEFIETLLTVSGYQVFTNTQCDQHTIEFLQQYKPDVMIFDYWLNDVKSDKIIKEIKKYDALSNTPIILISAIADLDTVAKNIPIDDYMKKPFDIHDLLYKIKNIVHYA